MRDRGLDTLFNDCNRRLTLFAPNNNAFITFDDYFNDEFFSDRNNFPINPIRGEEIILRPTPSNRDLEEENGVDEDFRQNVMSQILGYQTLNGLYRVQNLVCGNGINMIARGTTTTVCDNAVYVGQIGTCNRLTPNFSQVNIVAANGIIHVMTEVMIPSPDATIDGCADIGVSSTVDSPNTRSIIIEAP